MGVFCGRFFRIYRCKLVQFAKRGNIEASFRENLGCRASEHCHQTDMNKLGGLLAKRMYPEKSHVATAENEL